MKQNAIEVDHVSLEFCLYSEKIDGLKEYAVKRLKNKVSKDSFWALKDVSFNVKPGEAVGLVGKERLW